MNLPAFRPISSPSALRILFILAAAAALTTVTRAGENFTTFIKSVDMSWAYYNSFAGSTVFPWDATSTSTMNTPFTDLKNNGVNYVRLSVWQSTTSADQGPNLSQLLQMATDAKANNGLKLYIDAIPADGGQDFKNCPSEWQADYNLAHSGNSAWAINANCVNLESDVKAYYENIVGALANNGTKADIVSIGNEINQAFVDVPTNTPLYYELLYKGAAGVKAIDSSIAVLLHLHDIDSSVWTECNDLANCNSKYAGAPAIDFDVFGFSFHAFNNPLYNPNWAGSQCVSSNGETIGLKNAFQSENFGQFTNESTGNPDSGNPIYLMVSETAWPWTGTNETVNGTSMGLIWTSTAQFTQDKSEFTFYSIDNSGYRQYLIDEMNFVSGLSDGLGKGVNAWAGADVAGWGRHPDEYNFAFWDSATGALLKTKNNYPIINAYLPNY